MLIATETRKASVHGKLRNAFDVAERGGEADFNSPPRISQNHAINSLTLLRCLGLERDMLSLRGGARQ